MLRHNSRLCANHSRSTTAQEQEQQIELNCSWLHNRPLWVNETQLAVDGDTSNAVMQSSSTDDRIAQWVKADRNRTGNGNNSRESKENQWPAISMLVKICTAARIGAGLRTQCRIHARGNDVRKTDTQWTAGEAKRSEINAYALTANACIRVCVCLRRATKHCPNTDRHNEQ